MRDFEHRSGSDHPGGGARPAPVRRQRQVIPHRALGRLLTLSVTRTNCPHFGLLVGRRATILSLGMVGRLMQHSETFGDAMHGLVSNLSIQDRVVVPSLEVGRHSPVQLAVYQPETESADQITDGASRAPSTPSGPCRERLDADRGAVAPGPSCRCGAISAPFPGAGPVRPGERHPCLPEPLPGAADAGADPMLRAMLEERIQQLKGAQGSEFSDDIRRLLRTRLTSHHCSADEHRRTAGDAPPYPEPPPEGDGMGYRAISNEIRFEIARQLLQDTQVPLGQIAAALGYSEASAFTRAFRRWSGQTPTAWRARHRATGSGGATESGCGAFQRTQRPEEKSR